MQNNSSATPASASQPSWWERFQAQGYAFRWVASATIVTGIYLHVTRLLIGDALLQQYILTPLFDQSTHTNHFVKLRRPTAGGAPGSNMKE